MERSSRPAIRTPARAGPRTRRTETSTDSATHTSQRRSTTRPPTPTKMPQTAGNTDGPHAAFHRPRGETSPGRACTMTRPGRKPARPHTARPAALCRYGPAATGCRAPLMPEPAGKRMTTFTQPHQLGNQPRKHHPNPHHNDQHPGKQPATQQPPNRRRHGSTPGPATHKTPGTTTPPINTPPPAQPHPPHTKTTPGTTVLRHGSCHPRVVPTSDLPQAGHRRCQRRGKLLGCQPFPRASDVTSKRAGRVAHQQARTGPVIHHAHENAEPPALVHCQATPGRRYPRAAI